MQRRIHRPCANLEGVGGIGVDRMTDSVAVLRAPTEGLQHHEIEGPLEEINAVLVTRRLRHARNLLTRMSNVNILGCRRSTPSACHDSSRQAFVPVTIGARARLWLSIVGTGTT